MTEPMTRVLHELCTEIDNAGERLSDEQQQHGWTRDELRREKVGLQAARDDRDRQRKRADDAESAGRDLRTQLDAATAHLAQREANRSGILDRLDRLTLDLYHYIVELAGYRDTAKTKAERVALGHVVARLSEIRGMNDTEKEGVA